MKIANVSGRVVLVTEGGAIDVAEASGGRFGPSPRSVYEQWVAFREWAAADGAGSAVDPAPIDPAPIDPAPIDPAQLGAPSPEPRQVFAVGANYLDHIEEALATRPTTPVVFTKFPTCITGPNTEVALPSGSIDWEAELVIVVGAGGHRIPPERAWDAIAGFTIGQDLSDRVLQLNYERPQFSLAKSLPGFGPTGPYVVTVDEFEDPNDMSVTCVINGRTKQDFRTTRLLFTVPDIIVELSKIVTLLPGDIIFTGTASGVGMIQDPPEYLQPGDEIVTSIRGIGSMTTRLVAG